MIPKLLGTKSLDSRRQAWDEAVMTDAEGLILNGRRDTFMEEGTAEAEALVRWSREMGLDPARERVLDLGCGTGRVTGFLASSFAEAHGIDISQEMIRKAREA